MVDETAAPPASETPPASEAPAAATPRVAMGDEGNTADDWSPPPMDENGTALDGHGLPINLRLRAAALADAGRNEDPTGSVAPERIAAEVERLDAFDKAYPAISANSATKDLERLAKVEGVDISLAANNAERVAALSAARPSRV